MGVALDTVNNNIGTPDLIVYGGCFDPPHLGHLFCLSAALNAFPNAEFYVVPTYKPPGIGGAVKTPGLGFARRVALFKELLNTHLPELSGRITVSELEKDLPEPNYTVITIAWIKKNNPNRRLALLMGQDQFGSFLKWHEPEALVTDASLIVVARPQSSQDIAVVEKNKSSYLEFCQHLFAQQLQEICTKFQWQCDKTRHVGQYSLAKGARPLNAVYFLDQNIHFASSTGLKKCLKERQPPPEDWIGAQAWQLVASLLAKESVK